MSGVFGFVSGVRVFVFLFVFGIGYIDMGIATRGVRVCVRMFGFLFVFGIGYTDSTGLRVAHDSDCVA